MYIDSPLKGNESQVDWGEIKTGFAPPAGDVHSCGACCFVFSILTTVFACLSVICVLIIVHIYRISHRMRDPALISSIITVRSQCDLILQLLKV